MNVEIDIPVGSSGDWKVEEFEVTEDQARFSNLQMTLHGEGYRSIKSGKYKKLVRKSTIVMSNTQAEVKDIIWHLDDMKGNILINGLGLGVLLKLLADKENVTNITVIEKSEDVIKLVAPYFEKYKKITIIHADAFTWNPPKGVRYNFVWHDIWDNICGDNVPEMTKLKRKYGRKCDMQHCWCEYDARRTR